MVKLRTIAKQTSGEKIMGLTCPKEISIFFEGVNFTVEKSGTSIIYTSGNFSIPSNAEISSYKFEDVRI